MDKQGMTAEANAATISSAYQSFSRGDIPAVLAVFDPQIRWHVPGRSPLAGNYRGHKDVRAFFERLGQLSEGTFRLEVDEIFAKGDRVVVLCSEIARRKGKEWASQEVHLWTMHDGRATQFRQFMGDEHTQDEFWSA